MSTSPPKDQRVALVAPAGSPTAAMYVYDHDYRVVAGGVGTLRASLPPGIYKIRYEAGSTSAESLFELPQGAGELRLPAPKLAGLRTPAPLTDAFETSAVVGQRAFELSKSPGVACGGGSQAFVFIQGSAEGLALYDFSDKLLVDFASQPTVDGCVGCNVDLDPGSYLLRLALADGQALEQTIVTCPGWQTQYFAATEALSAHDHEPRVNLANAALFMARTGVGFHPGEEQLSWVEMARQELAQGRFPCPSDQAHEATVSGKPADEPNLDRSVLADMADENQANPMLAIYAAHLMMLLRHRDEALLHQIADRLTILIGEHPDVQSINLWFDAAVAAKAKEVTIPPMLRSSWSILVNRSRANEKLLPSNSYPVRIADRLWGSGAWLVWRKPGTLEHALAGADIDAEWKALCARVTVALGDQSVALFVGGIASARSLTGLETTVLRYVAEVVHQQQLGRKLAAQLDSAGLLAPLRGLYRRFIPSDIALALEKAAQALLSRDRVVKDLGLPMAAVNEAVAGLVAKLQAP